MTTSTTSHNLVDYQIGDMDGNDTDLDLMGSYINSLTTFRPRPARPASSRNIFKQTKLALALFEMNYYIFPIIVVLGSIGNILAYLVFTRTKFRKVSSVRYLAAIAVTDTGFLWTFFLTNLQLYYQKPLLTYVGVCQLVMFLNYGFTFLSIWYMVALVVDRFIALYFPLKKPSMCTVFRAKLVIVGIGALAVVCYSYITYFYGVNTRFKRLKYCGPFSEFEEHYMNLDKIDIFFVAVIPYIVILLMVILILIKGCEYYKFSTDMSPLSSSTRRRMNRQSSSQSSTRITRVLCPVIIMTLLFNPPQNIMRTVMRFSEKPEPQLNQWLVLCRVFYLVNFAIKCFLYFAFSGSFRRRLKDFICDFRMKVKHSCGSGSGSASSFDSDPQIIRMDEDGVKKQYEIIQSVI